MDTPNELVAPSQPDPAKGPANQTQIYAYFGLLIIFISLASPVGLLFDIPVSFLLKNQLHASAETVAQFRLITGIPVYIACIFGLIRDSWNPFGLRDRGLLMIFAPLTAGAMMWLALDKVTLGSLTVGVLAAMLAFRLVYAAYQGLIALVGQEQLMTGRLSTVWNVAFYIPTALAAFFSGWVTENLKAPQLFGLMAVLCILIGLAGLWKPKAVFGHAYDQPQGKTITHFWQDVVRLFKHKAIYPAILINFMWNFAPGSATPLQYYLTNDLHLSDSVYSNFNGFFTLGFIPTFLLYGFLCRTWPLKRLLWVGTLLAVPQLVPLLFVHSAMSAQLMAIPIGLMGGLATLAFFDLAMRSCPQGLQGSLMMIVDGVLILSARGGDLLGTKIYDADKAHGFLNCVIGTTIVYALILPLILLIPKGIISTSDGQANPDMAQA